MNPVQIKDSCTYSCCSHASRLSREPLRRHTAPQFPALIAARVAGVFEEGSAMALTIDRRSALDALTHIPRPAPERAPTVERAPAPSVNVPVERAPTPALEKEEKASFVALLHTISDAGSHGRASNPTRTPISTHTHLRHGLRRFRIQVGRPLSMATGRFRPCLAAAIGCRHETGPAGV